MEFKPGLPERNSNVSDKHPLKEFFSLMAGLSLFLLVIYVVLGFLVDIAVGWISPEDELKLFRSINIEGWQRQKQSDTVDPKEQKWQTLIAQMSTCANIGYPVNLQMIQSDELNALAWPGGHVMLYSEVDKQIDSENGLAFVLAHELAHFVNRDHLKLMGRGAVVAAIGGLLGSAGSDVTNVLAPVNAFRDAQFSQKAESAADAKALEILNCHYGHVGGATEFFKVLQQKGDSFDLTVTHYFSSHPQLQKRIEDIELWGQQNNYSVGAVIPQ